jgi:hypothetical protein
MFSYRRVKNDERDAADLADLLRMGRLPEAWIAPPATRELRELVRHRKLCRYRHNLRLGYSSDRTSPGQWFVTVEALAGAPCSQSPRHSWRREWRRLRLRVANQVAITHQVLGDGQLECSVEDQPSTAGPAPVRSDEYPRE